ncbi:catalase family peroxidase [Oceanisphaera avium]|uniref:Catalase-related peroxidase n=1 Tax=Oceanisphaera avium TaxID=1903694 RepID=A0A1Y0CYK7_9GAMM|nr:catalase family peroxidase [Oceanisphaera avium]ART80379.1 catalase [Oceanisphaera avium]
MTYSPTVILSTVLLLSAPLAMAAEQSVTPAQMISAFESVFGAHKGERRNHTKGSCATGEFVGLAAAKPYTRAALFSGEKIPVIARFSLGGGTPNAPDTAKSARSMSLQFHLPENKLHHMAMLNIPMSGAATPQTFFDELVAKTPNATTGQPDPKKIKAFKATHPDSQPLADYLTTYLPPSSFANSRYFGVHTFKFINNEDETSLVRWRFEPQDGVQDLTEAELKQLPDNFLEQRLIARLEQGPVRWDMILSLGKDGDPETNSTLLWPSDREEVTVGTLTLNAATSQEEGACEKINFDPLVMVDGIAPTDDPVLLFRSPAYAVSFGKRLSGQ